MGNAVDPTIISTETGPDGQLIGRVTTGFPSSGSVQSALADPSQMTSPDIDPIIQTGPLQMFAIPTKTLFVDGSRTDAFVSDGTSLKPFRTIMAAVNSIAAAGDNATHTYVVSIAPGLYSETISLSNPALTNLIFIGYGATVNPNGHGVEAINNDNLIAVKFVGIQFQAGVGSDGHGFTFSSTTNGTSFLSSNSGNPYGCWFLDCVLSSNTDFFAQNVGGILWEKCNLTLNITCNNVIQAIAAFCVLNQTGGTQAWTLISNSANPKPNGWSQTLGWYQWSTSRLGASIDAGSRMLGYWSRTAGNFTVNGTLQARLCDFTGTITVNSGGTFTELGANCHGTVIVNTGGTFNASEQLGAASILLNGQVKVSPGNGLPNGAVVGNPGDVYINVAGGSLSTLWIKESGVGTNVGWVGK